MQFNINDMLTIIPEEKTTTTTTTEYQQKQSTFQKPYSQLERSVVYNKRKVTH